MPKKTVLIDYNRCVPVDCEEGVCAAAMACERHTLKQESPFEQPDPPLLCIGCGTCALACPRKAILLI